MQSAGVRDVRNVCRSHTLQRTTFLTALQHSAFNAMLGDLGEVVELIPRELGERQQLVHVEDLVVSLKGLASCPAPALARRLRVAARVPRPRPDPGALPQVEGPRGVRESAGVSWAEREGVPLEGVGDSARICSVCERADHNRYV